MVKITATELTIAIPTGIEHLALPVKRFVDAMVFKLHAHRAKGKWEELDLNSTLLLLKGEVGELTDAIDSNNSTEILLESADVANFAMIASCIATERLITNKQGKQECQSAE